MSDSSRSRAAHNKAPGRKSGQPPRGDSIRGPGTAVPTVSIVRTAIAALLVVAGIAWIAVYMTVAMDGDKLASMEKLGRWNFLIGFLVMFIGLAVAGHPTTPLGRGRGVVVGMLGCFLLGLIWIVVYYIAGQQIHIPLIADLGQYNLVVGIGFMAVGFVYATHWE